MVGEARSRVQCAPMRRLNGSTLAAYAVRGAGVVALTAAVGLALLPMGAMAAPAASADAQHREEAKAAFVRGNTAYNLGKYPEAIAAFEQAYALSRLPDILFNLGQCYRKQWEAEKRSDL